MRGTVKWFDSGKGFGFIAPEGSDGSREGDRFFHHREVERLRGEERVQLAEGQAVEFEEGTDRKGRRCAVKVRRV
jgi:CspA family cold shock protein